MYPTESSNQFPYTSQIIKRTWDYFGPTKLETGSKWSQKLRVHKSFTGNLRFLAELACPVTVRPVTCTRAGVTKPGCVILSFNHPQLTARAVNSALSFFAVEKVFLVHNGSELKNVDYLKKQFSEINHLIIPDNIGFAGGVNRGLSAAFESGVQMTLFLSNDTELISWEVPKEIGIPVFIAPRILKRQTQSDESFGGQVNLSTGELRHIKTEAKKGKNWKFYVPGASFVISREAFKLVGPFDESLHTYWEDVEYSLRARSVGVELATDSNIVVRHGIAKTCQGKPFYSVYLFHRNRLKVLRKYSSARQLFIFEMLHKVESFKRISKYGWRRDWLRLQLFCRAIFGFQTGPNHDVKPSG